MKALLVLALVLSTSSVFASDKGNTDIGSGNVKNSLIQSIKKNSAVRGAIAEAKKYAGVNSCGEMQILEMSEFKFRVLVDCTRNDSGQGVVGDGATGQVEISGSSLGDENDTLMIEKIEFHYAG
jgi:hypothetical protein